MPIGVFQVKRQAGNITPSLKLWLSSEHDVGAFGDGRWRLLAAVDREGTLQAASRALGMSYRKAWGALRKSEQVLGMALLEKHRGGRGGGETTLTAAGRQWLAAYSRYRHDAERAVAKAFAKHIDPLLSDRA